MQLYEFLRSHEGECWPLEKPAPPFGARARANSRAVIAVAVVLLALWVARAFLVALTWAALIAITAWPVYVRFARRFFGDRSPSLAALLFTLLTGLVLIVPIGSPLLDLASTSISDGPEVALQRLFRGRGHPSWTSP